jgi:hypothetical protein
VYLGPIYIGRKAPVCYNLRQSLRMQSLTCFTGS